MKIYLNLKMDIFDFPFVYYKVSEETLGIINKRIEFETNEEFISCSELMEYLKARLVLTDEFLLDFFNDLLPFETFKVKPTICFKDNQEEQIQKEKNILGLFLDPNEKRYVYHPLLIKPSNIKKAGLGIFALSDIPKNSICFYRGIYTHNSNFLYSWVIEFINKEGNPMGVERNFVLDGYQLKYSNFTRFINCGLTEKDNNMYEMQK